MIINFQADMLASQVDRKGDTLSLGQIESNN